MSHCDQCGAETLEAKTFINGEMQKLCSDCKAVARDEDPTDTDNPTDEMDAVEQGAGWATESIREDWHPNTVRLPAYLQRRFDGYHSRLDWQLTEQGVDRTFKKDRHYKTLVIALGLSKLDALDTTEIVDCLDALEQNQLVE